MCVTHLILITKVKNHSCLVQEALVWLLGIFALQTYGGLHYSWIDKMQICFVIHVFVQFCVVAHLPRIVEVAWCVNKFLFIDNEIPVTLMPQLSAGNWTGWIGGWFQNQNSKDTNVVPWPLSLPFLWSYRLKSSPIHHWGLRFKHKGIFVSVIFVPFEMIWPNYQIRNWKDLFSLNVSELWMTWLLFNVLVVKMN